MSRLFTLNFSYNSNHIEGNTLTYGQTELLLLFGKVIGEAAVRDVQEMTASNVGVRMVTEEARGCITMASRKEGFDGIIQDKVDGFFCKAGNAE